MTELAEQLADYVEDPHAIAANRFKPVTLITDWAVKFVKGRRDSSLDAPPIQVRVSSPRVCVVVVDDDCVVDRYQRQSTVGVHAHCHA